MRLSLDEQGSSILSRCHPDSPMILWFPFPSLQLEDSVVLIMWSSCSHKQQLHQLCMRGFWILDFVHPVYRFERDDHLLYFRKKWSQSRNVSIVIELLHFLKKGGCWILDLRTASPASPAAQLVHSEYHSLSICMKTQHKASMAAPWQLPCARDILLGGGGQK